MNCATHNTVEAVAYCRSCGKALCATCSRPVHGVIYCENCLAARLEGVQSPAAAPAAGFVAPGVGSGPVQPMPGPNPTVAGILAGFFPFGVGSVYTSQYTKGLAHLGIFVLLIIAVSSDVPWYLHMTFGLAIAFFWVYQVVDAVRTAKAIQMGQPAPDPFGLVQTFSTGQKADMSKVPTGAIVLIGLGVLFMLHTMGGLAIGADWLVPAFLILLGGWLGARRLGLVGTNEPCRGSLVGPAVLVTIGALWLAHHVREISFLTFIGVLLVVIGLVKVVQGNVAESSSAAPPVQGAPASGTAGGDVQPPSSEVHHV